MRLSDRMTKNILFVSNTNKLPQRTVNLIKYFKKCNDVLLISWQRDYNLKNNFDGINYLNITAANSIVGMVKFYLHVLVACWKLDVDCGFCNNIKCLPVLALICRLKSCPVIYDHCEFPSLECAKKVGSYFRLKKIARCRALFEFIENQVMRLTHGVLTVDSKNDELLNRIRKYQANVACIMNYPSIKVQVDDTEVDRFKKRYGDRKIIVYGGSVFGATGLYRYLDLVGSIKSVHPTVLLLFVGMFRGENGDMVRKYIREHGLSEHVEFLPWMEYERLLALLQIAKVGLALHDPRHTKFSELSGGNSRKVFTYMQAALPVIVSLEPIGKFVEQHGVGKYVDFHNDQEVLEAVQEMMANDSLRREMGVRGRRLVQEAYNWEKESEKAIRVYRNAFKQ